MTRTQFLLLLYKKLLLPALLLLVAYYAVQFIISLIKGDEAATGVVVMAALLIAFVALLYGLERGTSYLLSKLPPAPAATPPVTTAKVVARISDIAIGLCIMYFWQKDKAAAITMAIIIVYSMVSGYNKQKAE